MNCKKFQNFKFIDFLRAISKAKTAKELKEIEQCLPNSPSLKAEIEQKRKGVLGE